MSELTWREMHEFAIEQQVVLSDRVHELNQEVTRLKAELIASDAALKESRANDMESMRQLAVMKSERDCAVQMLADWCDAIRDNGTGWDDWDEYYKDADFRPCLIRGLIDSARIKEENK